MATAAGTWVDNWSAMLPLSDGRWPSVTTPAGRLRVMQVVLSLEPGGTERLVIDIARTLEPVVQSVVCCLEQPGAWASELTSLGIPVVALGRRPGFHPSLGRQIAQLASAHSVDVLHCHHYSPFVYGQIAALLRRPLRVVFTEHGRLSDSPPSRKRRVVNPLLGRLPAAVFAVSDDLRRHMVEEGFPPDRVRVVHNGIDPGAHPASGDRLAARRLLGLNGNQMVIGTVGRLDPVKDLSTLLQAFKSIQAFGQDTRLVIVGDGPDRGGLQQQAQKAGLGGRVLFAGYRSDIRSVVAAFDIYANSSTHEGVSLTLLEAMAAALPVVATAVGGTPEVVLHDATGLLVPARSPGQLAAAIGTLMADPERRCSLGRAGRARVETDFSVHAMTNSYLDAYRRAVGAREGTSTPGNFRKLTGI